MIVELAVWLAASVLLCDHVLLRPVLFAFHLGREVIDRPPEGRLHTWAAVWRALRRTYKTYWTISVAAFAVLVIALVARPWSGLVLIATAALSFRAWRWHQNAASAPAHEPIARSPKCSVSRHPLTSLADSGGAPCSASKAQPSRAHHGEGCPRVSMASGICPVADSRTARSWPTELPGGGQVFCPLGQLVSGVTPLPAVAWVRRMLSPAVRTTWAWCSSRSTVALAMVLGISSSNPAGWRLLDKAMERFS